MPTEPLLGAHMSIAGGVHLALVRGRAVGCRAIQLFTGSTQQWHTRSISAEEAQLFRRTARALRVRPVASHASYLINLAASARPLGERSRRALRDELERTQRLHLPYLVIHPGAHGGTGARRGLRRVARALESVLADSPAQKTRILLETTAGQGTSLGARFEELAEVIHLLGGDSRLGVCVDTCHMFAAGYDLRTEEAYRRTMEELVSIVGLPRIRLFHLNDSRGGLGSRLDRHTHIGQGELGRHSFRLLLHDSRFRLIPMILETPKDDEGRADRRNLALLRRLARSAP